MLESRMRQLQKPYRPWVSREQCVVRVAPDGAATLTSRSQYVPTLWRPSGGDWVALYRDDTLTLTHGDQVSIGPGPHPNSNRHSPLTIITLTLTF